MSVGTYLGGFLLFFLACYIIGKVWGVKHHYDQKQKRKEQEIKEAMSEWTQIKRKDPLFVKTLEELYSINLYSLSYKDCTTFLDSNRRLCQNLGIRSTSLLETFKRLNSIFNLKTDYPLIKFLLNEIAEEEKKKYDIPLKFTQAKLIIDIFEKNQYQIAKTYFNIGFTEQYHRGKFQNQDKIREDLMRDKLKQVFYSKENI